MQDAVTRSSWLRDDGRVSYLLLDDMGIGDGERYTVELQLDRPLTFDGEVVLHFLSHTNSEAPESN